MQIEDVVKHALSADRLRTFRRTLANDFAAILRVIGRRCGRTAEWMSDHESVTQLLVDRPT